MYKTITMNLISLSSKARQLMEKIISDSMVIKEDEKGCESLILEDKKQCKDWTYSALRVLEENELHIEVEEFIKPQIMAACVSGVNKDLNDAYLYLEKRRELIIKFAKEIEISQKKHIVALTIDDLDNFRDISKIKSSDAKEYANDFFKENDVIDQFTLILEENYKENHSGSEIYDLFSDRVKYQGKRVPTAIMFKGRGEKGELTIKKCGKNGNQLIKLSKAMSAQCFIVQHTNKISQDVRDALQDHLLANSKYPIVYTCFIDGLDTARFMKLMGKI